MSTRILVGDCRALLATLPDASVHCCVTSPPYFGLRDYGTASWSGGDVGCDHVKPSNPRSSRPLGSFHGSSDAESNSRDAKYGANCGKCGAIRVDSQIGLESTPDAYIAEMVSVFREVKRVLRDDGTLWLNIGDSYAGGKQGRGDTDSVLRAGRAAPCEAKQRPVPVGLKPKDLIGIPWMLAFALRADGWYLRSDVIWHKPNPMPESVTDRPTKSHEYLFLLSKNERYFYDADAIKEPSIIGVGAVRNFIPNPDRNEGTARIGIVNDGSRNRRTVWTVATQPFAGAHFATFPPKIIEPCILAGTSPQACEQCSAPWERVCERTPMVIDRSARTHDKGRTRASGTMLEPATAVTTKWQPTCTCENVGSARCVVLDPFGGAGTTALVADRLGRDTILIELNPDYAAMTERRLQKDAGLFADVAADHLHETPTPSYVTPQEPASR